MRQRNDGTGEENILQNQFTAYLLVAVHRYKAAYAAEQFKRQMVEVYLDICEFEMKSHVEFDLHKTLPILDQIENPNLLRALLQVEERELGILLARALDKHSFDEIANELNSSYKAVSNAYYRLRNRLKQLLESGDDK